MGSNAYRIVFVSICSLVSAKIEFRGKFPHKQEQVKIFDC